MAERKVLDRRNVPFVMVTKHVIEDERLKASDKSVYATLCMYADNATSECFPKRETILRKAGVSDKTLRNSIKRLTELGYIDVKQRYNSHGKSSNLYVLLDAEGKNTDYRL